MSKRGFPPKYVRIKILVMPEDEAYLNKVNEARGLDNRNAAARLIFAHARTHLSFLTSSDANVAAEQ